MATTHKPSWYKHIKVGDVLEVKIGKQAGWCHITNSHPTVQLTVDKIGANDSSLYGYFSYNGEDGWCMFISFEEDEEVRYTDYRILRKVKKAKE